MTGTTNRLFTLDLGQLPTMLFGGQAFRLEEFTDGSTYVVRAEVPGVDPDKDIAVSQFGNRLQIRVERTEERIDKAHSNHSRGPAFGRGPANRLTCRPAPVHSQ